MTRWLPYFLFVAIISAQPRVSYEISFENAVHHEARVVATFSGLSQTPLNLRMSRTSPGRYALHEYAKNVYDMVVEIADGRTVLPDRPNPYQWDITGHGGVVKVSYTVFGDHADGTYAGIDETHAHLNMPAVFMFARGLDDAPVSVVFWIPEGSGWKAATQLQPTDDPFRFTAPGLQYFMDSPTELSAHELREWTVPGPEGALLFRLALHHDGSKAEADIYSEMAKRIVVEAAGVFGEFPTFENRTYWFLADYLPYVHGDGMEHRNSTFILSSRRLRTSSIPLLSTLAHEFFHAWNVERIRPSSLEPFDFEEANMSSELWFAEGVTSYYDNLLLARAGIKSTDAFVASLSSPIDEVVNLPGRKFYSAAGMSRKAPFRDAATSVDAQNTENVFISYYTWGEAIGIALDLTLRTEFEGRTLDGFMRRLWELHGKKEIPYTNTDLMNVLGEYAGDGPFAKEFFGKFVLGHEAADYATLLSRAGLELRNRFDGKAGIGPARLAYEKEGAVVTSRTRIGSPLYAAGVDKGDTLVMIDGTVVRSPKDLNEILERHKPGDLVEFIYVQRGIRKVKRAALEETSVLKVVTYEAAGREVTDGMKSVRARWLNSRALERYPPLTRTCPTCKREYEFPLQFCGIDGDRLPLTSSAD